MAQPSDIEVLRTIEYRKAVGFQLNETPGKLKALCGSSALQRRRRRRSRIVSTTCVAVERTTRNGDTDNTDVSLERRWIVKPRPQDVAPLIDRDDQLATEIGIKSPIAVRRPRRSAAPRTTAGSQGFYGNAYTGEEGATQVGFKAANILAVNYNEAGAKGITINKLIGMKKLMMQRFVNLENETPICIYTAEQLEDLLSIAAGPRRATTTRRRCWRCRTAK
jgi:hypothetical protein